METLFLIVVLLAFSACFSSFETAIFALSPMQRLRLRDGGGLLTMIGRLLERPRQFLTTILLGNEVVNVSISILAANLAYQFYATENARAVYLVSTAVTTLVILIFGEIVPKNFAVRYPVILSQTLIVPYQIFAWLVFPFRFVFDKSAEWIVRIFGADPTKGRRLIVEEEFRTLLEVGKKRGTIQDLERILIQNALDFSAMTLHKVMTQRENVLALPVNTPLPEILKVVSAKKFSRIPVYENDLNHVLGILLAKEILPYRLRSVDPRSFDVRRILKPHIELYPEETLDQVFQKFQKHRVHMGIVRDRTLKVIGLVTMDDLLRRFFPQ